MKKGSYERDPIAYRIAYSRVAHLLHIETNTEEQAGPPKRVREVVADLVRVEPSRSDGEGAVAALLESLALLDSIRQELEKLGWRWVGWPPSMLKLKRRLVSNEIRRLGRFLDQVVEPCAVVLYFSARIETFGADERLLEPRSTPELLSRRGVKLGCVAGKADPTWETERWLREYLDYLMTTPSVESRGYPGRYRWSARIGWRQVNKVNPRVRYNVACMYSRLGYWLEVEAKDGAETAFVRGIDQLKEAIADAKEPERAALANWAPLDPALDALKRSSKSRFEDALSGALISAGVI